jgi:hypothetical protein
MESCRRNRAHHHPAFVADDISRFVTSYTGETAATPGIAEVSVRDDCGRAAFDAGAIAYRTVPWPAKRLQIAVAVQAAGVVSTIKLDATTARWRRERPHLIIH